MHIRVTYISLRSCEVETTKASNGDPWGGVSCVFCHFTSRYTGDIIKELIGHEKYSILVAMSQSGPLWIHP